MFKLIGQVENSIPIDDNIVFTEEEKEEKEEQINSNNNLTQLNNDLNINDEEIDIDEI